MTAVRLAVAVAVGLTAARPVAAAPPAYADRWVYCMHNLLVDRNADEVVRLVERAGRAGYTGVVLADYKFNILGRMPENYFRNARRVKAAADAAGLEVIPAVFPFGYSNGLLAHDPNLAEGPPVKDAPFVVRDGRAVLDSAVSLRNGGFEEATGDKLVGMGFQDGIGQFTFVDRATRHAGAASLRMQTTDSNCRVSQRLTLRPWACYRLSAMVKTAGATRCGLRLAAIAADGRPLTFHEAHVKPDQDWTETDVVFNTLGATDVNVYVGVWGGLTGAVWVDDWAIEELALVNVLRRDACPLTVTNADGSVTYEEGKDFQPVRDPKLGRVPYDGEYEYRHRGAEVRLTPGSRIRDGEKLRVSWYHPILVHGNQVACSLTDPKVFAVCEDQAKRVHELFHPKTWFFSHDEIRVAGWDRLAVGSGKTPGQQLAENVRRCWGIVRKLNPEARAAIWSDMFDPHHNAQANYYLVNGSLVGSWEGLPADVIVANWNSGKAAASLKFFADRGHKQVLAGYYDAGADGFRRWDRAATGVPGVSGFMYTTWRADYRQLEEFGRLIGRK